MDESTQDGGGWVTGKLGVGVTLLGNVWAWGHSIALDNPNLGALVSSLSVAGFALCGGIIYFCKNVVPEISKASLAHLAGRQKILSDGLSGQMTILQESVNYANRSLDIATGLNKDQAQMIAEMKQQIADARAEQAKAAARIEDANKKLHEMGNAYALAEATHANEKLDLTVQLDEARKELDKANAQLVELRRLNVAAIRKTGDVQDQADRNSSDIDDLAAKFEAKSLPGPGG